LDCTILLASGDLRCGLTNDAIAGPFLVPQYDPSGFTAITSRASARDAFEAACPQDYREASEPFVPSAMREQRISLIASLYSARMLRYSTTEQTLQQEVFEALKTDCRKESVQFPRGFEVVLCHETSLSNHFFVFAHSGLLFKTSDHYCYIEKAGAPGPFVRLDFAGRATLTAWLTGTFRVTGRFEPSERFVTYNNTKIEKLPPAVWPANSISPINAAVTH
jgi:hypothetical protein